MFFYLINRLKSYIDVKVFVEFRTIRICSSYETSTHYRRFVEPEKIIAKLFSRYEFGIPH